MASRVSASKLPELGREIQLKVPDEPTAIQPDQVWDQLTRLQQRQVVDRLVQVGRQLVQQVMTQEVSDEHA